MSNVEKIAIITDSGTNVPRELIEKYNIFELPLLINYSDGVYRDNIDMSVEQICERLQKEIPTTSLPSIDTMMETFEQLIDEGYNKTIVITISSGLSGTYNAMRLVCDEFSDRMDTFLLDTRNIDIGAGFSVIRAAELIERGLHFDEIKLLLNDIIKHTKIFFCLSTLEYLRKGGRIGLVAGAVGSAFQIKPVMSCNDDGVYYVVKKARGRNKSLKTALKEARAYADQFENYNVVIAQVGAEEEANEFKKIVEEEFPNVNSILMSRISPALIVHTGEGLVGIGIQKI